MRVSSLPEPLLSPQATPLLGFLLLFADAIIMDDVEKLAKARKKQASLFVTKPLRSPASAQVRPPRWLAGWGG